MNIVVAALYHFFDFPHFEQMRERMLAELNRLGIRGSLLVAAEGINGTVSGSRESIDALLGYLEREIIKGEFEHKESFTSAHPFSKTKVRLKRETISIGEPVALEHVGKYVDAKDWNALISDPDTIVLDARNNYEAHLGTFERAITPDLRTFKKFPAYIRKTLSDAKHKKIATFCTGGIRCEKLTSWMAQEGFKNVYHLKGGILKYLEEVPEPESKWQGDCYVFDERIAVRHGLLPSKTAGRCEACDHTLTKEDQEHPGFIKDRQCPHCMHGILSPKAG